MQTPWHHLTHEKTAEELAINTHLGLSNADATLRRQKYGLNKITPQKRRSEWMRFLLQYHQPLLYILLAASLVTFYLDEIVDAVVIFGVVFINALVGYLQEAKAEKAIEALSQMVKTETTVLRDGIKQRIPSEELVPGDIVILQSGDKVPADLRLFYERNLQVDESALTGESIAVEKNTITLKENTAISDRRNIAFAATLVTYGQAKGIVCETGDRTEIGRIAKLTSEAENLSTPLTIKITELSKLLLFAILGLAGLTFMIGILRGNSMLEMFMASVALAVGAIPEGLPAAVTITMAIGVSRMARRKAIIRKLPAVEALGSATVICSDKTGTLTENQMTVQEITAGDKLYLLSGSGYDPAGHISSNGSTVSAQSIPALRECLTIGLLCNDSKIIPSQARRSVQGDPTEGALIIAAEKGNLPIDEIMASHPRIDTLPFESEHQYMATLHQHADKSSRLVYIKGSIEKILDKCSHQINNSGNPIPLDRNHIHHLGEAMASRGLRVLAFAKLHVTALQTGLNHHDLRSDLTFVGLQGMIDPPRPEAIKAIHRCQSAGIKIKMITGDHLLTAMAIAKKIGLTDSIDEHSGITGKKLESLTDEELAIAIEHTAVFARVVPEQKLRLVKALQARGHIAAMTGDGVNDAPALKQANIGIAMGITGTDVAKNAADMLLTDDNFASIESAVEEGRCVFDNLSKFIVWTLPTNMGEAMLIITAIFAGAALPALPVQLLWINMTTAIFLGLMLVFEPKEEHVMLRPPRPPTAPILTKELLLRTGLVTLVMLIGGYGLFIWTQSHFGASLSEARTIVVNVIVMVEIFYLLNCRSLSRSIFSIGVFSNMWIWGGIAAMLAAQLLLTYIPLMNKLFHTSPIALADWLLIIIVSLAAYGIVEFEKWLRFGRSKTSTPLAA